MWNCLLLVISSVLSPFVSAGPLDESKSALNSNPFIIIAQSAESADTIVNQFDTVTDKHSTETVQIVTSATVEKESTDKSVDTPHNKEESSNTSSDPVSCTN
eukprot:GFUD01124023.1.p1 GENE.GFUD01124023.1~~GFUD01124023.1.p1  ORF type:complete len:102 (+),score=26.20 GFUD01124023.1:80-385(+)